MLQLRLMIWPTTFQLVLQLILMLLVSGTWHRRDFITRFGRCHTSPNSGYPEAALVAILDCRFGGAHVYFGEVVEKPYIGTNERNFNTDDVLRAIRVNNNTELIMGIFIILVALIH